MLRGNALALIFLVFCVTAVFVPAMTGWQGLFHDDQAMEEFPRYVFVARSLQNGVLPLWDPHTWCGAIPFYGRYFADTYYLPLWPFYLITNLQNLDLSYWTLILLPLWLHYAGAAVGMFVLLRMLLCSSRLAAALGSLAYVFSPAFAYGYVWQQVISTQAWLPWLLIFYLQAVRKISLRNITLSVAALTCIITAGAPTLWPQVAIVWLGACFVLTGLSLRQGKGRALIFRPALILLAAAALGSALSGPYLLSFFDALKHTSEHIVLTPQAALSDLYGSIHPFYLATLFFPDIFGNITGALLPALSPIGTVFYWEANLNAGMAVTFLVMFGLISAFRKNKNPAEENMRGRWLVLAAGLYIFALLCALGRYTPFYEFSVGQIPGAGSLPRPLRYRMLQCLSAAVLAAGGIDYLRAGVGRMRLRYWTWGYVAVSFCVLIIAVSAAGGGAKKFVYPWLGQARVLEHRVPDDAQGVRVYAGDSLPALKDMSLAAKLGAVQPAAAHMRGNILYWFIFAGLFLLGAALWAPGGFSRFLVLLALGELFVFGSYAMYRGTYSFDRPSPNHVRSARPSRSGFTQAALALSRGRRERTMRAASAEIFHDNFLRLTGDFAFMGYEMHPLEKRFKRAVETAYGATIDYPLYYRPLTPQATYLPFLSHFSVAYFLNRNPGAVFSGVETVSRLPTQEDLFLHVNPRALPRAYTVAKIIPASEDQQLRELLSGDLSQAAYIDRSIPDSGIFRGSASAYSFEALQEANPVKGLSLADPNRITVDIEVSVPAMLVITDVWYPGWKARIDGRDAPVRKVNYCQRGVLLERGRHTVVMYFSPFAWRLGLMLTGTAVFILLISAVWLRLKSRPAGAAQKNGGTA